MKSLHHASVFFTLCLFALDCKGQKSTTAPVTSGTTTSTPQPPPAIECPTPCHTNATCIQIPDNPPSCQCNVGFSGDGRNCTDLCSTQSTCHQQATCVHTGNPMTPLGCACNRGWTGNGTVCTDINECANTNVCPVNTTCQNNPGSFICRCPSGYTLNGSRCVDVNECVINRHECSQNAICINTPGFYNCQCKPGYLGDGSICRADPCNTTTCGTNATCRPVDSSGQPVNGTLIAMGVEVFSSCVCDPGLGGNPYSACTAATTASLYVSSAGMSTEHSTPPPTSATTPHTTHTSTHPTTAANVSTPHTVATNMNTTSPPSTETTFHVTESTVEVASTTAATTATTSTDQIINTTTTIATTKTERPTTTTTTTTTTRTTTLAGIPNPCVSTTCAGNATCFVDVYRNGTKFSEPFPQPIIYSLLPTDVVVANCRCNPPFSGDGTTYCAPTCTASRFYYNIFTFNFPTTVAPQWAYSEEVCEFTGQPILTVQCVATYSVEGYYLAFENPTPIPCTNESLSTLVSQIPVQLLNSSELDTVLTSLDALTYNTTNLNTADINAATSFINDVAANATTLPISAFSYQRIVNVADHVTSFFDLNNQTSGVSEADLVKSLTTLAYQVVLPTGNSLLTFSSPNIEAEVLDQQNPTQEVQYSPVIPTSQNGTNFIPFQPVSILIPLEALLQAEQQTLTGQLRRKRATTPMTNTTVRAVFLLHKNSTLFPSTESANWVVSGNVGNQSTSAVITNLANPVNVTHNTVNETAGASQNNADLTAQYVNETCVFWNFTTQAWSTEGCCLEPNTNPPQCKCNHLTNFALLVSIYSIPPSIAQQVVSIVGCSLSIASLVLTIVLLLISKEIRNRRPMRVLMNICANLAVVYLIFLVGIDKRDSETGCVVSAILLHYFLLVAWCWMAVYGHLLYKSIVKIFHVSWDNYLIKVSALSYGLPMIVIAITTAVNKVYEMPSGESPVCGQPAPSAFAHTYLANNMCWIHGYSLYIAFLLPVACLISFNIAMFALVMRSLTCKRQKISSTSQNPSNLHNLAIALSIASTLGVVWFFGFFMMVSDNPQYLAAMSWLFTIVAAFQGFCVFVLTCVRQGDVRRLWWPPVRRILCCGKEEYPVVSSSKSADGSGSSTAQGTGLKPLKYEENPELFLSSSKGTQA